MSVPVAAFAATPRCLEIFDRGEHALVGLSPFNGYYTRESVAGVLRWIVPRFAAVDVLLPGWEAAHTLTRTGVPARRAVRKARRDIRALANMAIAALVQLGVAEARRRVHTWTRLLERPAYRALLEVARACYDAHPDAHPEVRAAVREIVVDAVWDAAGRAPDDVQLATGAGYLLAELPFLMDSPAVFGVPSSVFVYHRRFPLAERLYAGDLAPLRPAPNQGVLIVTSEGALV